MKRLIKSLLLSWCIVMFTCVSAWALENINGTVTYNGTPVCAMVLANGQYMFTCSGDGSFSLDVPLDGNGEITVFAFCSGLSPYSQVITPGQGTGMQIEMQMGVEGAGMDVAYTVKAMNSTMVLVEGALSYNGYPICAMALANGQYDFTCSGDGSFSLLVPLDDLGTVTLFGFCAGLPPYQVVIPTSEIDFTADDDSDGYTVSEGECNDFNASINPGATDIPGDGIDQDCNGSDAQASSGSTLADGIWYVTETSGSNSCGEPVGVKDYYSAQLSTSGSTVTIVLDVGTFYGTLSGNTLSWTGSYPEDGGTTTINLEVTIASDGKSVSGSSSWRWSDGYYSCSGFSSISAVFGY